MDWMLIQSMKFLSAQMLFILLFYFFPFACLGANPSERLKQQSPSVVNNRYDLCYSWDTPY